jgi:hypothetical protein
MRSGSHRHTRLHATIAGVYAETFLAFASGSVRHDVGLVSRCSTAACRDRSGDVRCRPHCDLPYPLPLTARKASTALPNAPAPNAAVVSSDRFRNWRRVTPIASSSGGARRAGGADGRGTGTDAAGVASLRFRDGDAGATDVRSLWRVSWLSRPVTGAAGRRVATRAATARRAITRARRDEPQLIAGILGRGTLGAARGGTPSATRQCAGESGVAYFRTATGRPPG